MLAAAELVRAEYKNGGFELYALERAQLVWLEALMEKYRALPMDVADASLVLLAEHRGHGRILSTDQRSFETYRTVGFKHHEPFENLLLPSCCRELPTHRTAPISEDERAKSHGRAFGAYWPAPCHRTRSVKPGSPRPTS